MRISGSHLVVGGTRIPLLLLGGIAVAAVLLRGGAGAGLMVGRMPRSGTPAGAFVPIMDGSTGFAMPNPSTGYLQGKSP